MRSQAKILLGCVLGLLLTGCDTLFEKDNTEPPAKLVDFKSQATVRPLWSTSIGSGTGDDYLRLNPSIAGNTLFTADSGGKVTALDATTGRTLWSKNTNAPLTSGVATSNNLLFVGGKNGAIVALRQDNGNEIWRGKAPSEVLATPAAANNVVIFKSIDGTITGFAADTGHQLWQYNQAEPTLILRSSSTPQVSNETAIIGFANGKLSALSLNSGTALWQQTIAEPTGSFAIQRMVDIDADPVIINHVVYAATYQGRVAALDLATGKNIWQHDISSYAGIAADNTRVYVSDAHSHVWAFDQDGGSVSWQQKDLQARNISGPALMENTVVVGDGQGYLHWLDKQDGHFVARVKVSSAAIIATPLVVNTTVYVITKDGRAAAYSLS